MFASVRASTFVIVLAAALAACGEEAPAAPTAPAVPTAVSEPVPEPEAAPEPMPVPVPEVAPAPMPALTGEVLPAYLQSLVRAADALPADATGVPACTPRPGAAPASTARAGRMIDEARLREIARAVASGARIRDPRPRSGDPASFVRDEELDALTAAVSAGRDDPELAARLARDAPYVTVVRIATLTPPDATSPGTLEATLFFVERAEGRVLCAAPLRVTQPAGAADRTTTREVFERQALQEIVARFPAELTAP